MRLLAEVLILAESICAGLLRIHYDFSWRSIDSWIMCGVIVLAFIGDVIPAPILEKEMLRTSAWLFWIDVLIMLIHHPVPYMIPRYLLEVLIGCLLWWLAGTIRPLLEWGKHR